LVLITCAMGRLPYWNPGGEWNEAPPFFFVWLCASLLPNE